MLMLIIHRKLFNLQNIWRSYSIDLNNYIRGSFAKTFVSFPFPIDFYLFKFTTTCTISPQFCAKEFVEKCVCVYFCCMHIVVKQQLLKLMKF